jgi:cell division protein ZapA
MTVETKKYKVDIFGDSFTIVTDEPEEHVIESAKLVDSLMREISEKTQLSDIKKLAIFTAFQISSKLGKLESEVNDSNLIKEKLIGLIDKSV